MVTIRTKGVRTGRVLKKSIVILFCFVYSICYSQVGVWTWMNGSDSLYSLGHYGIQGVSGPFNTPPGLYEPCEWQDQQGNFWLFGGFHGNMMFDSLVGDLNDLWKYDPNTNEWTWMKGSGMPDHPGSYGTFGVPSPTNLPAARGWGTPTWSGINNTLWIYGGEIGYNDLWKYDISTNEWTWMHGSTSAGAFNYVQPIYGTYQVPSPLNTPGTRFELNTSWIDNVGNLWLFGGGSMDSATATPYNYNDLWKYDISINQWIWMAGPNIPNDSGHYGIKGVASPLNRPPGRCSFSKWKDNAGNFYLFGGFRIELSTTSGGIFSYNDVWKYELNSNNWIWIGGDSTYYSSGSYSPECITTATNNPKDGWENRATSYDSLGNVYLFGGAGGQSSFTGRNELWHYSSIHNEWTLMKANTSPNFGIKSVPSPLNAPPQKLGSISWLRNNNEFWVFGGNHSNNSDCYNDLFRFVIDTSCIPSGIFENEIGIEPIVFPNPANSSLTISVELQTEQNIEYKIYTTLGEIIYYSKEENVFGKFEKKINVENLSSGIYFLQMRIKDVIMNEKIVKQ